MENVKKNQQYSRECTVVAQVGTLKHR